MVINLHVHGFPYREWLVKLCRASDVLYIESKYWVRDLGLIGHYNLIVIKLEQS